METTNSKIKNGSEVVVYCEGRHYLEDCSRVVDGRVETWQSFRNKTDYDIKDVAPAVRLINCGWTAGKCACDLAVGDKLAFNYGYTGTITKIERVSKCFLAITAVEKNGEEYTRKRKATSLVPVAL